MLLTMTVENVRSIRDETTLDLRSPGCGHGFSAQPWDGSVQPVVAIYGHNAAGKSTVIEAARVFSSNVLHSYQGGGVATEPFKLDPACREKPSTVSMVFIASDGKCYEYGYSELDAQPVAEWCVLYRTARPTLLFERDGQDFRYGTALSGPNRTVEKIVHPDALYLSAAAAAHHPGLEPVYRWFREGFQAYATGGHTPFLDTVVLDRLYDDVPRRERVAELVRRADLGLTSMSISRDRIPDEAKEQMRKGLTSMGLDPAEAQIPEFSYSAALGHQSRRGDVPLDIQEESEGTRAWIAHAYVIDEALATGRTVFFDELDTSLHPRLLRDLIGLFTNPSTNPHQAQLVFTTHDVTLIDSSLFDPADAPAAITRDALWFVEKDDDGASHLIPAGDVARTRDNLARRYLTGRYGGVPLGLDLRGARSFSAHTSTI